MLKHLPLKIFSLFLAAIFWIFVVSLENTFFQFPEEIPLQVFNLSPELALTETLPKVKLTVRADDPGILRKLSVSDFEAYIDLRAIGAGANTVSVSVTSHRPQVSVVKVMPREVAIELEPVRKKLLTLVPKVKGDPANGFHIEAIALARQNIEVTGAEKVLATIAAAEVEIELTGNEDKNFSRPGNIRIIDRSRNRIEGLSVESNEVLASVTLSEKENSKSIGVRAKIKGSVKNGTVKNIEVIPAVVSVTGSSEVLSAISFVETEAIDLKDFPQSGEKKIKLVLPPGVKMAPGDNNEVVVKIEIEMDN